MRRLPESHPGSPPDFNKGRDILMLKRMMRKEMSLALAGLKYHAETGALASTDIDLPVDSVAAPASSMM